MAKIYIRQQDNDHFFGQKLPTFRNGFCYIERKVTLVADPLNVYDDGEFGYITANGKKLVVIGGEGSWEIDGEMKA